MGRAQIDKPKSRDIANHRYMDIVNLSKKKKAVNFGADVKYQT
jgi:hypothetical protein